MHKRIFLSQPDVTQREWEAAAEAVRSGWLAPLGPEVDAFEADLERYVGGRSCVVLSSGTAALHLGLLALGAGPGDFVITPSLTFAATANAATYTGATPVFVDSDASGNIDAEVLGHALRDLVHERSSRIAAVVPVDLLGRPADHSRVAELAAEYGIAILSDAAESFGSRSEGRQAATFGSCAAVSFNGNKVMTTSGGGALFADDDRLLGRVRFLATQARLPVRHYEHNEIGFNYRLSNVLAAIGRVQLSRLEEMIERRRQIRTEYERIFENVPGVRVLGGSLRNEELGSRDNCWLTSIQIDPAEAGFERDDLILWLEERAIESRPLWKPMHLQPVYQTARFYGGGMSEQLFARGVALPSGSAMTETDLARVECGIVEFLSR